MVVDLLSFDMIANYILLFLFFGLAIICLIIAGKFWKTDQKLPWVLIFLCMLLFFVSHVIYVLRFFQGIEQEEFGLSIVDWMTYLSIFLFSLGTLSYYSIIVKKMGKGVPLKEIAIVYLSSFLAFLISMFLTYDNLAYSLAVGFSALAGFSSLALFLLFRGGHLSKPWFFFTLSVLIIVLGVFIVIISDLLAVDLIVFYSLSWVIGCSIAVYSLFLILKD